jgi:hypothetical protein
VNRILTPLLASLALLSTFANGQVSSPSEAVLDAVAKSFRYPRERLQLKDLTQSEEAKSNPKLRAAYLITAADNTFAYVQVVATEEGGCLTPGIKERFEKVIEGQSALPQGERTTRKVEGSNGTTGYVAVAGMGPGGSATRAVMHIPAQKVDWQLTVNESNETPLDVKPEMQEYYDGMQKGTLFISSALETCVQSLATQAAKGTFKFGAVDEPKSPVVAPTATPVASPPTTQATPTTSVPSSTAQEDGGTLRVVIFITVLLVVIVCVLAWKRRPSK